MNTQVKEQRIAVDMTEGPLLGKMIAFTIPVILTGTLQLLFNATDLVMVGRFAGSAALAGVGCCGALINLIIQAFLGLSTGAGVIASQSIGAHKNEDLERIINTSFITSVIAGIAVGLFGFFAAEPMLTMMYTPTDVLPEATSYMQAYFVGMPAMLIYNYLAAILRAAGDTKRPLAFLTIAGVANVGLNFIMLKFFGLGAMGVGIATSASQYISAVLMVIYFLSGKSVCRLTGIKPTGKILSRIVMIGLPAGVQGSLFSLSNVLIQSTVNGYGTVVVAGSSAAANIEGFLNNAVYSVHQASINFVGQNIGAGKYDRIKRIVFLSLAIVIVLMLVMSAATLIFGEELLNIYEPGKVDVIAAGMERLYITTTTYVLLGIMDILCALVRGMGLAVQPMLVSLIGSCALRIVWIYTVCPLYPTNIQVLYVSYPITWTITALAHTAFFVYYYKKFKRRNNNGIKELS